MITVKITVGMMVMAVLVLISQQARATQYYVSPDGNDINSGTSPGQAWKTISKVNGQDFEPGDSIFFEGGETFSGSLFFDANDAGTAANSVTVGSYGTGRATMSSGNSNGLYAYNCGGFEVKDLIFVGSGRMNPSGRGVFFYTNLSGMSRPEHIYIDNVDVSGYKDAGIDITGVTGLNGFKEVWITNAEAHNNGDVGIHVGTWPPPTHGWAHQDVYISSCKAYNNPGIPSIQGHTGNGILLNNTDKGIIEFCESYDNGWLCIWGGNGPVGLWAFDSNDVVIQLNESHHNKSGENTWDGGGFDLDGGCINCIMQYNYSHDNHGQGYAFCQYLDARKFKNNVCCYNISENDGHKKNYGAMVIWSTGSSGGIQNTCVYNNTFYVGLNTTGNGIDTTSGYIYNTYIYNNIIVTIPNKRVVNVVDTSGGWIFKGNCYWTYDDNIEINWGGTTYTSLAGWRLATGQETHGGNDVGFEADPCLINPGGGGTIGDPCLLWTLNDYRLKNSSPLIGEGLDVNSLSGIDAGLRDYYGTTIPVDINYDVGAHEYDVNALPVARTDNYRVHQYAVLDVNANLGVLTNDYAVGGVPTAILISGPNDGGLTFDSNGGFDYDPNDVFTGMDSFTYKTNDGDANSNTATVNIEVFDPHPVANEDNYSAIQDTLLDVNANLGVLANDDSPGGEPNAILVSGPNDGSLTFDSNGAFEYDPCTGFVGDDSFMYKARWSGYDSNVVTVTINVRANAPVANNDSYGTAKDANLAVDVNLGVLANDIAYKGTLTAILVSGTSYGSLILNSNGSFEYDPETWFFGVDSFKYKANDGIDDSNVATVYISAGIPDGWWKFDDGTGSNTRNSGSLGSSHDSTLINMDANDWVDGHIGRGALELDGSDDYVLVPALNLDSNTVTISAWIKRNGTQTSTFTGIVFSRDSNTIAGLCFGKGPGGWGDINHELAYTWNNEEASWDWHSGLIVPDSNWVFVAVVVEPNKARLYMGQDGSVSSATNTINHEIEEFDGATWIGSDDPAWSRHFKGVIDDVRIYNRALSQTEIEKLANPNKADFDGDGVVDFTDYSGLGSAWRSGPGDGNWYRCYDISEPNDNVIDELDVKVFTDNWLNGL